MSSLFLSVNHPEAGLRSFEIKADSSPTLDLGGFTVERDIAGSGKHVNKRTRKLWQIESVDLFIDVDGGDQEFLQATATSESDSEIVYQHDDGYTYTGVGGITGDIKYNTSDKTVSVSLSGGGMLSKIS
ncbi:MAG: hypothetical protein LBH98_00655 [Chitinispirillales bacterium]|nr:hypothetical protein [Chitinispirillales bacterium]